MKRSKRVVLLAATQNHDGFTGQVGGRKPRVDTVDAAVVDVAPPCCAVRRASPLLFARPAATRASMIGRPPSSESTLRPSCWLGTSAKISPSWESFKSEISAP